MADAAVPAAWQVLFVEAGSGADQHGQNATVRTGPIRHPHIYTHPCAHEHPCAHARVQVAHLGAIRFWS